MTVPNVAAMRPRPPDGSALLDELATLVGRYAVLPNIHALRAVVLWVAVTHGLPAFHHAPRLHIRSPEKRCGKSRLLDVIQGTAHAALTTINASVAAIFRVIDDQHPPTLLVDEADAIFGSRRAAEGHEDLRALLCAGYQRGRNVWRCVGPNQTPTEFPTFAMAALAGIGDLPDTITDRAVVITMRRRRPDEQVTQFRERRDCAQLADLRDRLAGWVGDHLEELEAAEPTMPVEDRAADTWEPLVAIADLAGGNWPDWARAAALALSSDNDADESERSIGVRLLTDCRRIFAANEDPAMSSQELVQELRNMDEAPWEDMGLNAHKLARRLRQYGVTPKPFRPDGGGTQTRGYRLEDLADAFERYLPPEGATPPPSPTVIPSQPQVSPVTIPPAVTVESVTESETVTGTSRTSDDVTVGDTPRGIRRPPRRPRA